jgi:hypothetical protein
MPPAGYAGGCCLGEADPSAPDGIAAIYKDLADDDTRTSQVASDVAEALRRPPTSGNCAAHTPAQR